LTKPGWGFPQGRLGRFLLLVSLLLGHDPIVPQVGTPFARFGQMAPFFDHLLQEHIMAAQSTTFEVFDYRVQDKEMRIQADLVTLNTLKAYLGSLGVESAFARDGHKVGLDIRSGAKPEYVRQLLEDWAE
jgi:hypothetical protein